MKKINKHIENIVYFKLIDFTCNLNTISKILKIKNYEGWNKGDLVKIGKIEKKMDFALWQTFLNDPNEENIEEQINKILNNMISKKNELRKLHELYKAEP